MEVRGVKQGLLWSNRVNVSCACATNDEFGAIMMLYALALFALMIL